MTMKNLVLILSIVSASPLFAKQSSTVADHEYKIICYFTNWAQFRPQWGTYVVDDINPHLCTHLVYSFVKLEQRNGAWELAATEWNDLANYPKFNAFKEQNPKLKTMVAVGGYNHGTTKFTAMSTSEALRKGFARNAISFLRRHGFDGLDLDWEFPGDAAHNSPPEDKQRFTLLAKDIREAFDSEAASTGNEKLLLSAAVACGKTFIDAGYEISEINKYVDWIGMMAYDLHGRWDRKTGANAPLYGRADDVNGTEIESTLNVDWAVNYYLDGGANNSKLIMGMGTYGQTYKLADSDDVRVGAMSTGDGASKGPYTGSEGFLSYYEICDKLTSGWERKWDDEQKIPYAYSHWAGEWVGYDDVESMKVKADYIKKKHLAGTMIWAIDLDDFTGRRCNVGTYSAMRAINDVFAKDDKEPEITDITTTQEPGDNVTVPEMPDDGLFKRVCYFTNWAKYRPGKGKFTVENIDPNMCTHVIFAFADVTPTGFIKPTDPTDDAWPAKTSTYDVFNALKKENPRLKTLLAIGGWTAGTDGFTAMTSSDEYRRNFVEASIGYLRIRGFDGLDMDWEFPAARGSPAEDRERFTLLLKELREAYDEEALRTIKEKLLLTAAVHIGVSTIDKGYEADKISKYVDWLNLMAYDFEGRWNKHTGANAPLYNRTWHWDENNGHTFNVDWAVRKWIANGAPSRKIVLGIGTYGQTYTLEFASHWAPGAVTTGEGGTPGEYTRTAGFLAYYEICRKLLTGNFIREYEDEQQFPYAYGDGQWVGYDDVQSVTAKMKYIKDMDLGGAMVWTMDTDDFTGSFCKGKAYPLLSLIKQTLEAKDIVTAKPARKKKKRLPWISKGVMVRTNYAGSAMLGCLLMTASMFILT